MTQDTTTLLLGAWRITERLTAGVDDREPDDDAKFLWFLDDSIVTGDQWAAWNMAYISRGNPDYGEIDVTRNDLNQTWLQRGIFSVSDDTLKLCMAGDESDVRPIEFASTSSNSCVLYVAVKCTEPLPS